MEPKADVVQIPWHISMGLYSVEGVWSYDRAAWDAMTPLDRKDELGQAIHHELNTHVSAGWTVPDGEEVA